MKKFTLLLGLAVALILCTSSGSAIDQKGGARKAIQKTGAGGPFNTLMNINNISMWVSYDGASARNPSTGNAGVTYPRGTSTTIYSDGFIWGGQVHDGGSQLLRVNGGTYQEGTVSGRIVSKGVAEPLSDPSVRIYRVRKDWETADLRQDAAELLGKALKDVTDADVQSVRDQYKTDWLEWPWQKGAPFYDRDSNGVYDPDPNGHYDPTKDEPGIAGADQVVWFVMNDLNAAQSQSFLGSDPIGLEIQVTLWAYQRPSTDQLGNVVFKRAKFIYKGTAATPNNATVENMYFGQWADPDLGDYSDDFEGCDTVRETSVGTTTSLGFVYNSTTLDRNFAALGLPPPSMGYDFFAGPLVPSPGDTAVFDLQYKPGFKNLGMTAWIYFAAGGTYSDPPFNYLGAGQWYNLLRGLTPIDGSPFVFPGTSEPTSFWLSGDPVAGTGNLDGVIDAPGDRRMMLSTGPFTMALGDTQEVVVALIGGMGADRLSSVTVLRYNDIAAQFAYNSLFQLPSAPPSPKLRVVPQDRQLVLDWGFDLNAVTKTEGDVNHGYAFQGYNVYQLPTATSTVDQGIKLATFDVVDNVTTILDNVLDPTSGQVLQKPVQIGKNNGISRYMVINTDKLQTKPLADGQPYYFAVTAYNFNPSGSVPTHSLESTLQIVSGTPQTPDPGVRIPAKPNQVIDLSSAQNHIAGKSQIFPTVTVVEPQALTGHNYALNFFVDTVDGLFKWALLDATLSDSLLYKSANFGTATTGDLNDDNRFPILDGMLVAPKEQVPVLIQDSTRWISSNPAWFDGYRFTGDPAAAFNGGVTTGIQLGLNYLGHFASSFNPFFSFPIEVRFGTPQNAYRLRRTGPHGGYEIQSPNPFVPVPFSVFDVSDPANPRQLTVSWRDQNGDGTWDPTTADDGLEVVFIYNKTYVASGTGQFSMPPSAIEDECTSGANADVVYGMSLVVLGGHTLNESAGTLRVVPYLHMTPADKFVFSTSKPTSSSELAKTDVNKINVFPNPYYGFNPAEANRFQHFVTFNHLPPGDWRIRIFSLSGVLVRYFDFNSAGQNANTQFATWDLNNQNNLPVASGIYVAYIEMPSLGVTKTVKVVIIQEQQVLNYY